MGELEGEIGELEERAARLDELAGRLEVGMETRFRGAFDGFDSRKTYCSYCGQAVMKKGIGEVARVVEDERRRIELQMAEREMLDGLGNEFQDSAPGS